MASERDPIPCPVCREVIIGPLSAAVHLSDMHGLSMYGALARLTAELDAARERERALREAHEWLVGVFRRACEIAEAAIVAGETPETASARLRDAIEADIAEINALVALSTPQEVGAATAEIADRILAIRSGSGSPPGEGEDEWEPMSMSMAGVAHPRLIPFRHRLSGVVAWVDQRAAARLRGEGGGE